jgi:phage terminase large subunit-like protein
MVALPSRQVKRSETRKNEKFLKKVRTRGERVIAFIEKFCLVPEGKLVGKPLRLLPFQKEWILAIYDNPVLTTKGILSIARKNGKTALIACILLAHLVGPEARRNSQICSGAMSLENAALVFDLASKMIKLNPELNKIIRIVPSRKRLYGLIMGVEYRALSAEGKTNMGGSPVLAILDEVGQVVGPNSAFVDAVITSQGAHDNPLLLAISTQAATNADLFSIWIDDAPQDPHCVCHVYSADEGADVLDEDAQRAANPALGVFRNETELKKMAGDASRMPSFENTFRNLYLNQRVTVTSPAISKNSWLACAAQTCPMSECIEFYAGLDLSLRTDLTAFVVYGLSPDGFWNVYPFFWTPEKGLMERVKRDRARYDLWVKQGFIRICPDAAVIEYDYVVTEIIDIMDGKKLTAIAFDRYRIEQFKKEMERLKEVVPDIEERLPLVPWGQGFKDMPIAIEAMEEHVLNKTMRHGGHPVLTMCAANAVTIQDESGNRKFAKKKTSGRIDGFVALCMASGIASVLHENEGDLESFINEPLVLSRKSK